DREKVERSNAAVIDEQRPAPMEYRVVWPDQSVHTVWAIPDERVADAAGHIVRLSGIVQDITERKQAEYAVRESEAKYRALYEGASIGIFHSTFEGQYLDLNPALARMLGYASPEEVLASVHDVAEETYVNPGRRAEIVAQVLAQGGFLTTENRYRRRGGADWDAQLHLRCVTDEAGRALYLEGFIEDITERKQAEADLRESKARLDLALQSAQMGAWSLDLLTGRRHFDDQTCRLLGLAPDAYQGTAAEFFSAIDPDDRADVQAALARTLNEDAPYQPEYRVIWPDGSRHYISGRGRLVRDEAGRPARVLGLIWDITERRRAEEALRIKDRALESSINALAISDLDGRLTYINPAFLDLWGYAEPAEVLGRSAVEFWQWPGQADEIVAALHATGGWAGELLARRPDGSAFEAQIAASLVTNPAGRPLAMLAAFADITARRRAEAELRQTLEELRRSNAELEQFAYVASHDLQEPLRGVTGMLQLLQRKYQGQLNADADELITYAVDAAARMQALINDLLALSRLERRGRPLEPTAAGAALGAALANLDTAITESGAQITAAALPTVLADPTQLIQVFQNLVGNALKFRGPQPPEIQVGAEREAGAWRFWVRDNGIGIEPQYFERIFAVFQRLHTRREYPGTGIGLALCKKIIERHGGRLWVESEPGRGATFYFTLPETSPPHAR
ncbi:MAG: PAS domain S-box protein, partial [Anaerolineales bacterium]|nr:PAS domain S-box protein [Anaerolineales bacterium]